MKFVAELNDGILIYQYSEDIYIIVNIEIKDVRVSRSWYQFLKFGSITNVDITKYDDEALEIIKNSRVPYLVQEMVEKEKEKYEKYGEEWKNENDGKRKRLKETQDEILRSFNVNK